MFRRHGFRGTGFRVIASILALVIGYGLYGTGWVGQRVAYAHDNIVMRLDTAGDTGQYSSLVLDPSGNPVVSYRDFTEDDLKLVRCYEQDCTTKSIVTLDTAGMMYTSLALDNEGSPVVAYYAWDNSAVKMARCDDPDCSSNITVTLGLGFHPSLVLDDEGNPVVSFHGVDNGDLRFVRCHDPKCTSTSIVTLVAGEDVVSYTSLALDDEGNPVVSYYNRTDQILKLVRCQDPACERRSIVTLDDDGDVGVDTSLALDDAGNPVVSYYDWTNGALKLVRCNDPLCEGDDESIVTLDSNDVGMFTSLALDDAGNPVVSYYDWTNGALKLVRCVHVSCTNTAPVARDNAYSVTTGRVLDVNAYRGVLANDFDPDPEDADLLTVRVVNDVQYGTLTLNPDGSFAYEPDDGFTGTDRFMYMVNDGSLEAGAVVTLSVLPARSGGGSAETAIDHPVLTDVRPNTGPETGGTQVTLRGENLAGVTAVRFGAAPALKFTVVSDEEIVAVAPPGTGTVEVRVTGPEGATSSNREALRFTYRSTPAAVFPDLPSDHWAHAGVELLAERGAVNGFEDGTFRPEAVVTRAEFVKLLLGVLGMEPDGASMGNVSFADVTSSDWHAPYVRTAVREGFVQGTSPAAFSPDAPLTREQLAVLLARALKLPDGSELRFVDAGQISDWARPGVSAAVAAGYLEGFPDGTFRPQEPATRAQGAQVLAQVLLRSSAQPPGETP